MTVRRAGATLALVLALAGCGGAAEPPPPAQAQAPVPSSVPVTVPFKGLRPTSVKIPKIGAESSLLAVALKPDGSISVPSVHTPMQAAWYKLSPVPGDTGPAIVLGHVDGDRKPGIFFMLKDLAPGDEVDVDRSDGRKLKFVVDRVTQVPKETFPRDAVYGNSNEPELRLITCGGAFDHAEHSYRDNIVVYAKLAS
ncbi:class F sortase [Amycolatopsis rifamycinica]|uniref:Peptidase C60 n=1 Tax=Amycolatopsis rifamycinica TaxID=287986 RepID=A0A066U0T5_9PSEU|nr:class F sortase [Amycolatopsis rifamycinica]KDN17709.1 peptidase C60 [Amycolatopsis rifamycinica]